jgi:hypothetical protein
LKRAVIDTFCRIRANPSCDADEPRRPAADRQARHQEVPNAGAAGFLGMPAEVLLATYGHHHPDFLHGAANAITSKHRVSVVESAVDLESAREKRQKA